jgi:hypothetical protein
MVLLMVPAATLFRDPPRWFIPAFWLTAVTGLMVQLIGLLTNPMEDMVRNHYYAGNWDYRLSYSPISGQLRLIWKYLHQAPAGLGLGWDRWFLFLHAAGAARLLVCGIELFFAAAAIVFGYMTWRSLQRYERIEGNQVGSK